MPAGQFFATGAVTALLHVNVPPRDQPLLLVARAGGSWEAFSDDGQTRFNVKESVGGAVERICVCAAAVAYGAIAAGCSNGCVQLLTVHLEAGDSVSCTINEEEVCQLRVRSGAVTCICWCDDGLVAAGAEDGSVWLIHWKSGRCTIGSNRGALMQRELLMAGGPPVRSLVYQARGDCCRLAAAAGSRVLVLKMPAKIGLFGARGEEGGLILGWRAHTGGVACVSWSSESNRIATSGEEGGVAVWDAQGLELARWRLGGDEHVTVLAWAVGLASCGSGGGKLSLGCSDGSLRIATAGGRFDAHLKPMLQQSVCDATAAVTVLTWVSDGSRVAAGNARGRVNVHLCPSAGLRITARDQPLLSATLATPTTLRIMNLEARAAGDVREVDWECALSDEHTPSHPAAWLPWPASAEEEAGSFAAVRAPESEPAGYELDIGSRVIALAVGHGFIVVATARGGLAVYDATDASAVAGASARRAFISQPEHTPPPQYLCLGPRHFVVVDAAGCMSAISYDGRALPPLAGGSSLPLYPASASSATVATAQDLIAAIDFGFASCAQGVRLWEVRGGRSLPLATTAPGCAPIAAIALSPGSASAPAPACGVSLAWLDAAGDVYLASPLPAGPSSPPPRRLAAGALDLTWHACCEALAVLLPAPARSGGLQVRIFLAPVAAARASDDLAAPELAALATLQVPMQSRFGRSSSSGVKSSSGCRIRSGAGGDTCTEAAPRASRISSFAGARVAVDRGAAGVEHAAASAHAQTLHACAVSGDWPAARRLVRLAGSQPLWAALAALAWPGATAVAEAATGTNGLFAALQPRLAAAAEALGRLRLPDKSAAVTDLQQAEPPQSHAPYDAGSATAAEVLEQAPSFDM